MSSLAELFDTYSRKARLYPALLVTLPVGISVALLWPGLGLSALVPIAVATGLPFFATTLVRSAGTRLEARLTRTWDGLPTTRMLRLRTTGEHPALRQRRRDTLTAVTGERLPTLQDERDHPDQADQRYVAATRMLITQVQENPDRHPLVQQENIEYGFRRNLLAVKPVALTLLALLLVVDGLAAFAGGNLQLLAVAGTIHIVMTAGWTGLVRQQWAHEQAQTYAKRLFEALDRVQPLRDQQADQGL